MSNLRDWTLQYSMLWAAAQSEVIDDCNCPEGFTANGEECEKVTIKPTIQPPTFTALQLVSQKHFYYAQWGTKVYRPDGSSVIYNNKPFWIAANANSGPFNRISLWTTTHYPDQTIGFSACFNIPTQKQYLIGTGIDNDGIIRIDGQTVVSVPNELRYYYVHPVTIKKGLHVIEMICHNIVDIAAFAAEIYDATEAQLMAIDNVTDLAAVTLFTTLDQIGKFTNLGTNGYPIDPEYALVSCMGDPPFYRKVEYANCE